MNSETYKIAICDDSQADVEYIAKLVKEWAKDKIVVIKTYPSAEAFMFNYPWASRHLDYHEHLC